MRITPRVGGRRIAQTALLTVFAGFGLASPAFAATYDSAVTGNSPLAYYRLDESAGATTAANAGSLGSSANGAYRNSVRNGRDAAVYCERRASWLDGASPAYLSPVCKSNADAAGSSAYFAGAPYNAQVQVSSVPESLSYTLEAWVKPTDANSSGGIVDHGDNGVLALEGGVIKFIAHATDGNAVVSGGTLSTNVWHHVTGSWNNATGVATLRVDGGAPATDTKTPLDVNAANGSPSLYIGWTNQDGAGGFRGYIDNVAYYGSALDLSSHYAALAFGNSGSRVTALSPEPGASFSTASTKWGSTNLSWTCVGSTNCDATVTGPGPVHNYSSATGNTVALPNDGAGSYTISITLDGSPTVVAKSTYTIGTFSTVILGDSPTAWWRFNEADGIGIAADSATGNLYPGAFQNPSQNGGIGISGDSNAARLFKNGLGGYVGVNNVAAKTQAYTIELWFKTSDAGSMALFDHGAQGGGPALYLEGGLIKYRTVDGTILTTPYTSGAWTYVAATWDGVQARLYKDNTAGTPAAVSLSPSGTPALYLGFANVGLASPAFRGLMDEVSYYGKALSQDRILDHYLADPPAPTVAAADPAPSSSGSSGSSSSSDSGSSAPVATAASAAPAAAADPAPAAAAPAEVAAVPAVAIASAPKAAAPASKAAANKARAQAKARAKARARARAKALAKARARAKAHARQSHRAA